LTFCLFLFPKLSFKNINRELKLGLKIQLKDGLESLWFHPQKMEV